MVVSETGVPAAPAGGAFRLYAEIKGIRGAIGSIETGVAVVNNTADSTVVTLELYKLDGTYAGFAGTLTLSPNGQDAKFLNEISGFSGLPTPFQGTLRVSSRSSISVLGLRGRYNERQDFLSTTTPATNEAAPASTNTIHFPFIADSGGYSTQFIFFSGQTNQSTSGTMQIFSNTGQPLNLILN